MGTYTIIVVIVLVFLAIVVYQNSWDETKENPIQSSISTGKSIYATSENIVDFFNKDNDTELNKIGGLPCSINEDCNILPECNNNCTCYTDGNCYIGG